jgi:hypothetical protein
MGTTLQIARRRKRGGGSARKRARPPHSAAGAIVSPGAHECIGSLSVSLRLDRPHLPQATFRGLVHQCCARIAAFHKPSAPSAIASAGRTSSPRRLRSSSSSHQSCALSRTQPVKPMSSWRPSGVAPICQQGVFGLGVKAVLGYRSSLRIAANSASNVCEMPSSPTIQRIGYYGHCNDSERTRTRRSGGRDHGDETAPADRHGCWPFGSVDNARMGRAGGQYRSAAQRETPWQLRLHGL